LWRGFADRSRTRTGRAPRCNSSRRRPPRRSCPPCWRWPCWSWLCWSSPRSLAGQQPLRLWPRRWQPVR
jgi:hypothetical protein